MAWVDQLIFIFWYLLVLLIKQRQQIGYLRQNPRQLQIAIPLNDIFFNNLPLVGKKSGHKECIQSW